MIASKIAILKKPSPMPTNKAGATSSIRIPIPNPRNMKATNKKPMKSLLLGRFISDITSHYSEGFQ